jgi:hypothetical protein
MVKTILGIIIFNLQHTINKERLYMTTETLNKPKEVKGGTFAPADIDLIKRVLLSHLTDSSLTLTPAEEQQAVNLVHRLGRIA